MKKSFFKVVFLVLILVFSTSLVIASNVQFDGITQKVEDTYVVKYGTTITLNGGRNFRKCGSNQG